MPIFILSSRFQLIRFLCLTRRGVHPTLGLGMSHCTRGVTLRQVLTRDRTAFAYSHVTEGSRRNSTQCIHPNMQACWPLFTLVIRSCPINNLTKHTIYHAQQFPNHTSPHDQYAHPIPNDFYLISNQTQVIVRIQHAQFN
jgi:hypothetical protein